MNITFVILHFLSFKDTDECIKSLKKINYLNKNIVIVDNGSNNGSYELLYKKYNNKKNIYLISNNVNLGFAKGCNIGFRYAKDVLKSEFIILLNNDTIINQRDFCDIIINKYKLYNYYVLGPNIITNDGIHQNPLPLRKWTIFKLICFKIKCYLRLIDAYLFNVGKYYIKLKNKKKINKIVVGDKLNVRLHGSCLIFSPKYINLYDGLDDRTFLYLEEDLLEINMNYKNHLMMYTSDLNIFHKEDIATNLYIKSPKKRNINIIKNLIRSSDICIKRLKEIKKG